MQLHRLICVGISRIEVILCALFGARSVAVGDCTVSFAYALRVSDDIACGHDIGRYRAGESSVSIWMVPRSSERIVGSGNDQTQAVSIAIVSPPGGQLHWTMIIRWA